MPLSVSREEHGQLTSAAAKQTIGGPTTFDGRVVQDLDYPNKAVRPGHGVPPRRLGQLRQHTTGALCLPPGDIKSWLYNSAQFPHRGCRPVAARLPRPRSPARSRCSIAQPERAQELHHHLGLNNNGVEWSKAMMVVVQGLGDFEDGGG